MIVLALVFCLSNPNPEIVIREVLAIPSVGRSARAATHTDAIEAQIVAGKWVAPKQGDEIQSPVGVRTWKKIEAGKDDWFQDSALQGGYAYARVESATSRVAILEAAGHGMVYVNGEPRGGDPYAFGYFHVPVLLKQGGNDLLFSVGRGKLRVKLTDPKAPAFIDTSDPTLPDLIRGEKQTSFAGVVVVNATTEPARNLEIVTFPREGLPVREQIPTIPPLSVRKVPVRFGPWTPVRQADRKEMPVSLLLRRKTGNPASISRADITLRVRQPGQTYKRTFISSIDDSVQYYAVNPANGPAPPTGKRPAGTVAPWNPLDRPALFLSLHGAGVEAIGQADAYSPKSWGHIVCPTNRRPYGFDWEDWGRLDAMEVLSQAQDELKTDPARVYLTGHSMGGHGTWQVGATFPDRFAAIGPSAGWISFQSYAGAPAMTNPSPVLQILQRAAGSSDTLALVKNYAEQGVYVLHGDADDNVPVTEERAMVKQLAGFHHDYEVHEQKGAGHWWDASDEPGADCVDWAPMFDLFAHHRLPAQDEVRQIDFTTMNPGVSSDFSWARIIAQQRAGLPSSIHLRYDPASGRVSGTTENVARLSIRKSGVRELHLVLDGQKLDTVSGLLERRGDYWSEKQVSGAQIGFSLADKNPERNGFFKTAFNHHFILVYGTKGTEDENRWAFARARFDAEMWQYRGNGSADIVSDTDFLASPLRHATRNVILYGNSETNSAWSELLRQDCPVSVTRAGVRVGDRLEVGDNLACLFTFPRKGAAYESVGVVSGTGISGMRLTDRLPYFVSGVAYPDVTLIGPEMLENGAAGVRAAGFFGYDWKGESGEIAWRDAPGK